MATGVARSATLKYILHVPAREHFTTALHANINAASTHKEHTNGTFCYSYTWGHALPVCGTPDGAGPQVSPATLRAVPATSRISGYLSTIGCHASPLRTLASLGRYLNCWTEILKLTGHYTASNSPAGPRVGAGLCDKYLQCIILYFPITATTLIGKNKKLRGW